MSLPEHAVHPPAAAASHAARGACGGDDAAFPCARAPAASALILGLILVPLACAGGIVVLYSLAFPSAQKDRRLVVDKALVSCRAALGADGNAIDAQTLTRPPSHASVADNRVHFTWRGEAVDVSGQRRPGRSLSCLGTFSIGALSSLEVYRTPAP